MKKFNWRDLAEIIGHVTIVAGLIFVGLQLNQSQDIAIATQYQERAAAAVEFNGYKELSVPLRYDRYDLAWGVIFSCLLSS